MKSDRQSWSVFPKLMIWITRLKSWMSWIIVFRAPESPNFPSSLLANPKDNNSMALWKVAPFALLQAYYKFCGASVICFIGINLSSYVNATARTAQILT